MRAWSRRDVFLKIEPLAGYSPLAPIACSRRWGRDAMYATGHELGRVQPSEIAVTTLDGLVYREYLDTHYTMANTAKLVEADVNEPPWDRRVPGAVLYARPGERLYIRVLNGDPNDCHSFHLHGLRYGIDSDGAWPFGVGTRSGRRSDEIRPGEAWTYIFDATEQTIGAWAFHDHVRMVQMNINRGLFGGLIVRDPASPCADHEVPMFLHQLQAAAMGDSFESATLTNGNTFARTFTTAGVVRYWCKIHGTSMAGTVVVDASAPTNAVTVAITDNTFTPASVSVRPGGTVTWKHVGTFPHIVFGPGGGEATFCLNGRSFVGNTPTIEAAPGETLRWFVFNLDVGSMWHNFHPHSTRWQLPVPVGGASDVHALSPAESFVADTVVPDPVRLPCALEELQCEPPADACRVPVCGDFLFHCHLEEHMMGGLAGLVRSKGWVWVTADMLQRTDMLLPFDDGLNDLGWVDLARCGCDCPTGKHDDHGHDENHGQDDKHDQPVDDHDHHHSVETPAHGGSSRSGTMMSEALDICAAAEEGMWELLPCDSQVLAVHAVLMHTGKVLFFAGSGNSVPHFNAHDSRSVVWDYHNGTFHRPTTPFDVFCAGQTLLADGKVLIVGGTDAYDNFVGSHASYIFDPQIEEWIRLSDMAAGRWYPSVVTLGVGRAVAASGAQAANEAYAPATNWTPVAATTFLPLYPHLILMADGRLFYSGGQLGQATVEPRLISPDSGAETVVPGLRDNGHRDQSCTVLLPPAQDQRVMILGGGPGTSTATVDIADLGTRSMGSYGPAANLHEARTLHNTVILPDRTVFVSGGGLRGETRQDAVHLSEIYDPVTNSWRRTATASVSRLYHSIALLLPDGRVVTAGSNPDRGDDELRLELFHPPYLFKGPRPFIQTAPTGVNYGSEFAIHTPQATSIAWVHLVRPMAVTHSDDCSQRLVDLPIEHRDTCHLHVKLTDNCNLAPPGWYMLFLCDDHGVPSVARWVHVGPLVEAHSFDDHHEGHPAHQQHPIGHLHAPGFPIPGFELLVPPVTQPATKPKRTARRAPSTRKAK